jgi:D-glycero-D-manno-heptose 1,7-bisphosphate phosphatase
MVRRRAVFLDRDGVLNRNIVRDGRPYAPTRPEQLEILPGVAEALARLHEAGFLNVVVTNQPDVANGKTSREAVEAMHAELLKKLQIDAIKVCFHNDAANCPCRKPRPGMLLEAARELDIDLTRSFLVGDRWKDIAAAHAAGCKGYFVDEEYSEKRPDKPYVAVKSLPEAVAHILESSARAR